MRRESPYPMVSVDEARRLIAAHCAPLGVEEASALDADGRVLAEDVLSGGPLPDMPKSAVDGYALRAEDGAAPREVLAEITAGASAGLALRPGTAVRIMTGAPLPPGADAVIMVEQTEERDGVLTVQRAPAAGDSIHAVGQDLVAGELVLQRGTTLGAADVGLLATVGRARVRLYRRPVVAVLATGDEVYEPDGEPIAGGVRDSNRYALLAAAREAGCATISLGIARDDEATQRAAILDGLARADVLITSGGVSMGTRDLIKPLLAELGTLHFGRVAFKPGKPTTFATAQADGAARLGTPHEASGAPHTRLGTPHEASGASHTRLGAPHEAPLRGQPHTRLAFGLPGYPVSSLVSFEVFVRPALRMLQGDARPERPLARVALAAPIRPSPDRPEYQRVVVSLEGGRLIARSTGAQGSSRLLSLRGANGLLLVPPGARRYEAGEELEVILTGPLR